MTESKGNGWFRKYLDSQFKQLERLTVCVDELERRVDTAQIDNLPKDLKEIKRRLDTAQIDSLPKDLNEIKGILNKLDKRVTLLAAASGTIVSLALKFGLPLLGVK